jgi:hypothetical protein
MPLPGEQVWGRRPAMPSSETETRSRGRLVPARDRASREGGGRPALERGGVPLEGRPTLERDGSPLEGAIDPRARRICTEAVPYPSSGAEFCLRVAGPIV